MKFNRILIFVCISISLASCNMVETLSQNKPSKNYAIENKIVSINQANLTRSYQECIKDGKKIDALASQNIKNSISLFHKSARVLVKCNDTLKNQNHFISKEDQMKNLALGIQNFVKSGDLKQANIYLEVFKNKFNKDLMYPDGSSFTSSIELILNYKNEVDELNLAMINANPKLKNELKRAWYWKKK